MQVQIRFADNEEITVDTATAQCAVFQNLTATEASRALEKIATLPPECSKCGDKVPVGTVHGCSGEPTTWHHARIGGEWVHVRKMA